MGTMAGRKRLAKARLQDRDVRGRFHLSSPRSDSGDGGPIGTFSGDGGSSSDSGDGSSMEVPVFEAPHRTIECIDLTFSTSGDDICDDCGEVRLLSAPGQTSTTGGKGRYAGKGRR